MSPVRFSSIKYTPRYLIIKISNVKDRSFSRLEEERNKL
jgi:hypothetical protein